jgi:hypothetical protein
MVNDTSQFSEGPLAEGMKSAGIAPPDDLTVTPVLNADDAERASHHYDGLVTA